MTYNQNKILQMCYEYKTFEVLNCELKSNTIIIREVLYYGYSN